MKIIEIILKNLLLRSLLFVSKFSRKETSDEKEFSKILFIRLNRIGDALVTTPLLHLVKRNLNSKIYLLADKKNHFVFNNNPDIDEVIIFNKGLKGISEVIAKIKEEKIDTVVDLHDDVSTTVSFLTALAPVKNKFGLKKENSVIYTKTVTRPDHSKVHVVERLLTLTELFNISYKKEEIKVYYYPEEKSKENVQKFLDHNIDKNKSLIGINISAGSKARFWGVEKFKKLLNFLSGYDLNLLLLCSPEDAGLAEEISENKFLIYHSDFDQFAAMISNLDLLFTPDTAVVHLAAANHTPVFGVYVNYNTDEMIWTPYGSDFDCVITKEPDINNISFEEVIEKFKPFLEKHIEYRSSKV